MKKALLLVLTLSGLTAMAADVLREYHYVSLNKTWAEAQSYCRENFSDLATVSDNDENNRLQGVLQSSGNYAWLGLYDDLTNWAWTPGKISYNYNKHFSRWEAGQPDRRNCGLDCVAMSNKGHWLDFPTSAKFHAVCYYEQGPSRYILVKTRMDWSDAVNYCRSNFTGLVTVRNMSENNHISSLLSETTWIGLYRRCWAKWSDGSLRTIHNWNKGQTVNAGANMTLCAAVKTDTGKWWNVDCGERHNFICQKVINPPSSAPGVQHRTRFKLKFQSEADLTDPAIQQQLLEQLHAKLEKHGLSDFKLRWVQTDGQTFHKEQETKKEEGCGG